MSLESAPRSTGTIDPSQVVGNTLDSDPLAELRLGLVGPEGEGLTLIESPLDPAQTEEQIRQYRELSLTKARMQADEKKVRSLAMGSVPEQGFNEARSPETTSPVVVVPPLEEGNRRFVDEAGLDTSKPLARVRAGHGVRAIYRGVLGYPEKEANNMAEKAPDGVEVFALDEGGQTFTTEFVRKTPNGGQIREMYLDPNGGALDVQVVYTPPQAIEQ